MNDSSKLDSKLRALMARVGTVDPSFQVNLVVDRDLAADREPFVQSILAVGGTVKDRDDDLLGLTVPIGKVDALAEQESIVSIRLNRQHRMHSKKR